MSRSDRQVLHETLAHFELMLNHAQGDVMEQLVDDAVCMRPSAVLEVLNRLDSTLDPDRRPDQWRRPVA